MRIARTIRDYYGQAPELNVYIKPQASVNLKTWVSAFGRFEKLGKWISASPFEKADPQILFVRGDLRPKADIENMYVSNFSGVNIKAVIERW